MGQYEKIDSMPSYEAIFFDMSLKYHQTILMGPKQEFSITNTPLLIPLEKAS
jgi:hypothetical protein